MAVPTSPIHICNLALDRIGQRAITSIDSPTTPEEDVCARHYDVTRRELLRRFIFNFSKKYRVLTADSTKTPAFGYDTAYLLPADFIRLMALGDVTIDGDTPANLYDVAEGYIFTDSGDAEDGGLNMLYVCDFTTVAKFDALFVKLFALQLAADMAYRFTLKPSLVQGVLAELSDVALAAAAVAGQEKPPRRIERSKWRGVRQRGNIAFRDNRYI
jgi:hypothetical protein